MQTEDELTYFDVHPLKNLIAIDEIANLAPILDFKVRRSLFKVQQQNNSLTIAHYRLPISLKRNLNNS